jgi:hypothetical protein
MMRAILPCCHELISHTHICYLFLHTSQITTSCPVPFLVCRLLLPPVTWSRISLRIHRMEILSAFWSKTTTSIHFWIGTNSSGQRLVDFNLCFLASWSKWEANKHRFSLLKSASFLSHEARLLLAKIRLFPSHKARLVSPKWRTHIDSFVHPVLVPSAYTYIYIFIYEERRRARHSSGTQWLVWLVWLEHFTSSSHHPRPAMPAYKEVW